MKRRIAFVEIDTHAEIAANVVDLLRSSGVFQSDFYFSKKIIQSLSQDYKQDITPSTPKNLFEQISKHNYDLVIIGTAHRHFNIWNDIAKRFPVAIIIHNKNFTKLSSFARLTKIIQKEILYRLKLLATENLLGASKLFKSSHFLVLDKAMSDDQFTYLSVFFQKVDQEKSSGQLTVVIPGSVDQHRRDYFYIFKYLQSTKFSRLVHFVFLGKAGEEMAGQIENLKNFSEQNNFRFQYYKTKVATNEFEQIMRDATLLWCPLKQETQFFGTSEFYGETKMSGNIGDAITYAKVAVFPQWFSSNFPFIFRQENDLEKQFVTISEQNPDFSAFHKERVLVQFENVLLNILNSSK